MKQAFFHPGAAQYDNIISIEAGSKDFAMAPAAVCLSSALPSSDVRALAA